MDLFIPDSSDIGGYSMCTSPELLSRTGSLELAVKESSWPPAQWMHNKATEGRKVDFRFG